jgi:hypothetical protein
MMLSHLLGFIVLKTRIMVYSLKVEAIVHFPPPCIIPQLQSLQGKANFLRHFVANYAEITKGFMRLLKRGFPFCWDESAQHSFEVLKHALTSAPLLWPPDYKKYFLLHLATVELTIDMVFGSRGLSAQGGCYLLLELRPSWDITQLLSC